MKTLALELSSSLGSIAFRKGENVKFVRQFPADRKDSGCFYEHLSALREQCGLPERIIVGLGPGSYAGIRIAIATALGLRAASGATLLGLPSICAIDCAGYCVIGDARRSSYFFARVRNGNCIEGPLLMNQQELQSKLREETTPVFAAQPLPQFPGLTIGHPSAAILTLLGEKALPNEKPLEPIYLRAPYITMPKATPWTR